MSHTTKELSRQEFAFGPHTLQVAAAGSACWAGDPTHNAAYMACSDLAGTPAVPMPLRRRLPPPPAAACRQPPTTVHALPLLCRWCAGGCPRRWPV